MISHIDGLQFMVAVIAGPVSRPVAGQMQRSQMASGSYYPGRHHLFPAVLFPGEVSRLFSCHYVRLVIGLNDGALSIQHRLYAECIQHTVRKTAIRST